MIGYVGLGAMGRALAARLAEERELVVWDLDPTAVSRLVDAGATAAASIEDLGKRCDVVVLCLPTSSIVERALFGDGGLAIGLRQGAIVIDQTSGIPSATAGFAARLAERGIAMIDAPVAGGVPSAIAGQITIMASGRADAFKRARPVLTAISPKLFRCGDEVGAGQATKAINNLVNTGYRMATLEMLGLACRLGCSAAALTETLNRGRARSFVTQRLLPAIVEKRSSADFALGLMCKDVNQAADLAIDTGVAMPVSDAARALMTAAWRLLGPDSRLDDLVPFMERVTGASFAAEPPTPPPGETLALVETAMAVANRVVMRESAALSRRAGLDPALFGPVMAAGSGASVEGDDVLAGNDASDDATAAALDELSRRGAALGVPLTMTSQIRAADHAARRGAGRTT